MVEEEEISAFWTALPPFTGSRTALDLLVVTLIASQLQVKESELNLLNYSSLHLFQGVRLIFLHSS